jgi:hypothetical protein
MKIRRLKKTAMPARLGEIDGIVHPMPVRLTDDAKREYPVYSSNKMKKLVEGDNFLTFVFSELGKSEEALLQIYSTFVLEDEEYCVRYKEG